jgi:hypothetical protein
MTDLEPIDICRLQLANLKTRLEAEIKRREEAEEVIRHYGDEKNWQSPKGSLAVIIWRPKGVDHATGNLGYLLAKEYLDKYTEGERLVGYSLVVGNYPRS